MLGRTGGTQHGPVHRLCRLEAENGQSGCDDDRDAGRPPDPQRGRIPPGDRRSGRIRREQAGNDDHRHPAEPPGHRIRLHPGRQPLRNGRLADLQSQNVYRKAEPRTGENIRRKRRIFLEFGHFHLEDRNDPRKFRSAFLPDLQQTFGSIGAYYKYPRRNSSTSNASTPNAATFRSTSA